MSGLEVIIVSHAPSSNVWVRDYDCEQCSKQQCLG